MTLTIQGSGSGDVKIVAPAVTSTFDNLTDTPGSKVALNLLRANAGGVALEYLDPTTDFLTQYLLADGTRAMTGALDMGGFGIANVATLDNGGSPIIVNANVDLGANDLIVNDITLGDGLNVNQLINFNVTGTDPVLTASDGLLALTGALDVTGDLTVGTDTLVVDSTLGRVGVNVTPSVAFSVGGVSGETASFFGDSPDVGDGEDGAKLIIHRKAAEGDANLQIFVDQYTNLRMEIQGNTLENLFYGFQAGRRTTTNRFNIALGNQALRDERTGENNFAVGKSALVTQNGASRCFGLGTNAGLFHASGDDVVLLGYLTGRSVGGSIYSEVTYVGNFAGYSVTTASGGNYFGFESGYFITDTDNLLIIDNQRRGGTGAPTNDTDSIIYGVMDATPANQMLNLNASVTIANDLTVGVDSLVVDAGTDTITAAGSLAINGAAHTFDGLNIGSADGTDTIGIYHDNSNANIRWNDGVLNLQTTETDTVTSVQILGQGTGYGAMTIFDQDNAEQLSYQCISGYGYIQTQGTAPQALRLQFAAEAGVELFQNATEGETQELSIAGYRTGDAKRQLLIGVGKDADDTASFDGVSNYRFDGAIEAVTGLTVGGNTTLGGTIIMMANLPTSDPSNTGQLWNNGGVVTVS